LEKEEKLAGSSEREKEKEGIKRRRTGSKGIKEKGGEKGISFIRIMILGGQGGRKEVLSATDLSGKIKRRGRRRDMSKDFAETKQRCHLLGDFPPEGKKGGGGEGKKKHKGREKRGRRKRGNLVPLLNHWKEEEKREEVPPRHVLAFEKKKKEQWFSRGRRKKRKKKGISFLVREGGTKGRGKKKERRTG